MHISGPGSQLIQQEKLAATSGIRPIAINQDMRYDADKWQVRLIVLYMELLVPTPCEGHREWQVQRHLDFARAMPLRRRTRFNTILHDKPKFVRKKKRTLYVCGARLCSARLLSVLHGLQCCLFVTSYRSILRSCCSWQLLLRQYERTGVVIFAYETLLHSARLA